MMHEPEKAALASLLAWYRAMGADAVVGEEPIDWLARGEAGPGSGYRLELSDQPGATAPSGSSRGKPTAGPPAVLQPVPGAAAKPAGPAPAAPSAAPRPFPVKPPDEAVMAARATAHAAKSLEELRQALSVFDGCGLKATAKNLCFYRGAATGRVMIIGEAPGREEDLEGKPFVGRAGQLLDRILQAAGLDESQVHITNVVYWRPPGNRTPTPQEAQVCRPFLERQIELVDPDLIVLLGGVAAKHMLDAADGIMKLRGTWRETPVGKKIYRVMATLHPAYLLRTPASKRQAWRDFLVISEALSSASRRR